VRKVATSLKESIEAERSGAKETEVGGAHTRLILDMHGAGDVQDTRD
jgi:hypothetical protein